MIFPSRSSTLVVDNQNSGRERTPQIKEKDADIKELDQEGQEFTKRKRKTTIINKNNEVFTIK